MAQMNDWTKLLMSANDVRAAMAQIDKAMSSSNTAVMEQVENAMRSIPGVEEKEQEKLRFAKLVAVLVVNVLDERLTKIEEQLEALEVGMRLAVGE